MDNKYTASVDVTIGDKTYSISYDWLAISDIVSKYGRGIFSELFTAPPEQIADLLVIGLRRNHPDSDITTTSLMFSSPPLLVMTRAIDTALSYAYFGADGTKEIEAAISNATSKKKTPGKIKTVLKKLFA